MQASIAHTGTPPENTSAEATPQAATNVMPAAPNPPHATSGSNLAPTSEFARYVLLALPARYTIRGLFGKEHPGILYTNTGIGIGSAVLSTTYSNMVKSDIMNLFSEAVGFEHNKPHASITMKDLRQSENRIVAKTLENWNAKTTTRLLTDALFFVAPLLNLFPKLRPFLQAENRIERMGDFALGVKGVQLFAETWKRQPTLFEHITALVNNKINPKNGLGQAITVGEVFDLYQHYHFQFNPQKAFTNVFDNDTGETHTWSGGKPVFDRMTELLNLTYSYKHATSLDPKTGEPIRAANFTLPKFIYLLGNDMIDPAKPEQTLMYIELASTHGMEAVKSARQLLAQGQTIAQITERFPVTINTTRSTPETLAPTTSKKGTKPIAEEVPPSVLEPIERSSTGTLVSNEQSRALA